MSADCAYIDWPDDGDYFEDLFRRARAARVPLSGTLELTRRCNLRCVHCYLGSQDRAQGKLGSEMTTDEVLKILDQVVDAGCLSLLITGGDPLLRRDFPEVYRHAKLAGLDVTVFTNGTPITDQHIALFQELPPRRVEITLYGATAETYERITGVSGSFERCLAGVRRLHDGGIRLGLKTMLMAPNCHEFEAIRALANSFDAKFRFDPILTACLDGEHGPLGFRLSPQEAVQIEFTDEERRRGWLEVRAKHPEVPPSDRLIQCGAGQTGYHIDAFGNLQPCLMLPMFSYSLRNGGSFAEGWAQLAQVRQIGLGADSHCATCQLRLYCGYCPGLLALENGEPEAPSDFLCSLGAERFRVITMLAHEEDPYDSKTE